MGGTEVTNPIPIFINLLIPYPTLVRRRHEQRYSESDAQKVENVLETLNKCRKDIVERFGDLSCPIQGDCLVHYFKCLCMVDPLFTAVSSDADDGSVPITFFWYDAFHPEHEDGVSSQRNSIQLEKAAVLFNLGAVCSQIGASCDRNTALPSPCNGRLQCCRQILLQTLEGFCQGRLPTLDLTIVFAETLHCLFSAQVEARQRRSSILPKSQLPKTLVQSCPLDLDAELVREIWKLSRKSIPKQQRISYLDLLLSEYSSFKIMDGGKLVANLWDMPPPYPTNLGIISSSALNVMLPIPLKKSEPLDLSESLRSYVALKYTESKAKRERVEGLFKMVDKLHSEM
ncbi:hypothetical protein Ahy_B02g057660 isoform G [Arachis hypogaea]|uniref:BRO1 domain-containing protein n=1 Tax=Arachis hypogaea TaxID=3818 RepID=A0A445ACJ2_ARAHY|nr:hypothetical protein Ahy_B02g057660 isoform G [Arachis hypogaea]